MTDFARSILRSWSAAACRRPVVTVLMFLLLSVLAGWYSAEVLRINTSTTDMIAPDVPFRRDAERYRQSFPFADDQIVVVVDSDSADRSDAAALRLAELMRARPDALAEVEVPSADPYFRRNGLLFLDAPALQDLATRLAGAQAALGALNEAPNLRGLAGMVDLVLEHTGEHTGENAPAALSDLIDRLAAATAGVADGKPEPVSWTGLVKLNEDERFGNRRFVTARPVLRETSFGRGRPAMDAVRSAVTAIRGEPAGLGVEARVTGAVALRQTELDTVQDTAGLATVLSFVLVVTVLTVGMRSWRMILCMMVTLVLGLTLNAGLAALTVGRLNLISVTCAVMFFGLGDDFGSHLGLRYQEERQRGRPVRAAVLNAARNVGPPLALSTACAIIGFLSFVPTDYRGLAEFGVISGLGMVVALVISLTLLPALFILLPPGPGVVRVKREDRRFAAWMTRHNGALLALTALTVLGSLAALPLVRLDVNPLNLQDRRTEAVRTYRDLATAPRTSPYAINILEPDLAAAQATADRLRGNAEVGGVRTFAGFIPKDQEAKLPIIADMALLLGPSLAAPADVVPLTTAERAEAVAVLRAALDRFAAGEGGTPEARAAAQRFGAALGRIPPQDALALAALDQALTGGVPPLLERLREGLEVERPVTAADVPDSIRRRWIAPDGQARVEVLPTHDISDSRDMARFAEAVLAVAPHATGAPVTVTQAGRIVLRAFAEATALTLVLIVLLLLVVQRSLKGIVLILAPLMVAALWTMAAAGLLDIPFNFANVIVIPLLFALGVSSSIHMVARGQELERAGSRSGDYGGADYGMGLLVTSTPLAVLVSTLTTSTAFATLAISSHRGLASMGMLLAIAITFTVVSALIVLPSLMIGWHRWSRCRTSEGVRTSPIRR
ncbi:MMPL family transporter [Azospirillum rugosum]|uniref:Hopanoid biosynthesis associated RND transporter like protein HpnN n=1 Tax=Azospirillum rugosum TaxID=416170 RepID=A0ABS4STB3_9PROT|nr:MMPL family transporter [Azospirillum rugosum]MBP2295803.1 hopanoid biosynthesis associated RND transporter like protein HpnN [Azospirillum rugosum]MDQ0529086.1 hopanoid biosynthesis associated RND transporter like protein HpnN [Azospirillum rugosum]